jgi:hypothetical protein
MDHMDHLNSRDQVNFKLPPNGSFPTQHASGSGTSSEALDIHQVYVDAESIVAQRDSAKAAVDSQAAFARDQVKADYEAQKAAIQMRYEHEIALAEAAVEQSRQRALFALEQQHQQRRLEIEQKSQEQMLQIDATANEMIMQAQQQKLQREMAELFAKHNMNPANASRYFAPTSNPESVTLDSGKLESKKGIDTRKGSSLVSKSIPPPRARTAETISDPK